MGSCYYCNDRLVFPGSALYFLHCRQAAPKSMWGERQLRPLPYTFPLLPLYRTKKYRGFRTFSVNTLPFRLPDAGLPNVVLVELGEGVVEERAEGAFEG